MENFFNYITKIVSDEEVDLWLRVNNIIPEKLELYSDFSNSLSELIVETYLGEEPSSYETKITLTEEDKEKHFNWCWGKIIDNFKKEGLIFELKGEHYDYYSTFFLDVFYNQKEEKVRNSINKFFDDLFDLSKDFTKSDLDLITTIYKLLDKNLKVKN